MAKSVRRASWFSSRLPLSWFNLGSKKAAPKYIKSKLYLESLEERTVPTITLVNSPTWVEQGAGTITNNAASTLGTTSSGATANNTVGGTINTEVSDYGNADIIFAGSANGGVWRTTDGTAATPTWFPLTDQMPSGSISALAINPFNTNEVIAGLGATSTGTTNGYPNASGDLLGAYLTMDANNADPTKVTWTILSNNIANTTITGVAVRNNYILVTNSNGLYRSTDNGKTFTLISGSGTSGLPAGGIFDLAEVPPPRVPPVVSSEPTLPDTYYVIGNFGLYVTNDGGMTWTNTNVVFQDNDDTSPTLAEAINAKVTVHYDVYDYIVYAGMVYNDPVSVASGAAVPTQDTAVSWINYSLQTGTAVWTMMDSPRQLTSNWNSYLLPDSFVDPNTGATIPTFTESTDGNDAVQVSIPINGTPLDYLPGSDANYPQSSPPIVNDVVAISEIYPNHTPSLTGVNGSEYLVEVTAVSADQYYYTFELEGSAWNASWTSATYGDDFLLSNAIPYELGPNTLGLAEDTPAFQSAQGGVEVSMQPTGLVTGDRVRISDVIQNAGDVDGVNGDWQVQVINEYQFILLGATMNGTYGEAVFQGNPYAPTALIQKWIDPTYGSDAQDFSMVADNYDPNLVYIGGAYLDGTFSNYTNVGGGGESVGAAGLTSVETATTNTGNVLSGLRDARLAESPAPYSVANPPRYKYGYLAYNPGQPVDAYSQWEPLTDGYASTTPGFINTTGVPTAPHNGTRFLYMTANYGILDGTEGGLYLFNKPLIGNETDVGTWTSLNTGLNVSEIYDASLDTVNNTLFAATNNTGTIQQTSTGSDVWTTIDDNLDDTTNRGNGYFTAVDNSAKNSTTSAPYSLHYTLGNNANNTVAGAPVEYQVNNAPVLTGNDAGFASQTLYNPYVINAVDPNEAMIGGTSTNLISGNYGVEELTLGSDTSTLAGQVQSAVNVTPANMYSQPSQVYSIAFGGKNPDGSLATEVAYLGTSSGELFLRPQNGTVFYPVLPPGLQPITGIVMDPNNWKIAYVVRGNDVLKVTVTTNPASDPIPFSYVLTNITDNLINSSIALTDQLRSIALWVDPTNSANEELVVGGRDGYFRRDPNVASTYNNGNTWSRYGANLPYVIGQSIQFVDDPTETTANDNELVAGTFGRGVWIVQDVAATIKANATVTVTETTPGLNILISQDPVLTNNVDVTVTDSTGTVVESGSYNRTTFENLIVNADGAGDTVTVQNHTGTVATTYNTIDFVNFQLTINGDGDSAATLLVDDGGNTNAKTLTISSTTIGAGASDDYFGVGGSITYSGYQNGTVTINEGNGGNTGTVNSVAVHTLNINDGDGVNSMTINGTSANATDVLNYNDGTGNSSVTVNNDSSKLNISTVAGNNQITVHAEASTGAIVISAGSGNDTVTVGTALSEIQGTLSANGGTGSNTIVFDDSADPQSIGTINGFQLTGFGTANGITYTNFQNIGVKGSTTGNNTITVVNTISTGTTTISTGNGNDTVTIDNASGTAALNLGSGIDKVTVLALTGTLSITGGTGTDTVAVDSTAVGSTLNLIGGGGNNTYNISSNATTTAVNNGVLATINGNVNITSTSGNTTLNANDYNSAASNGSMSGTVLTGFGMGTGVGIGYSGLNTFNLSTSNGSSGDSLTITGTITGTTNINTNNGTDTVDVVNAEGTVNLTGGSGNDTFVVQNFTGNTLNVTGGSGHNIIALDATTGTVNINAGTGGSNIVYVSGSANQAGIGSGSLAGIQGAVTINGGTGGSNTLNISDFGAASTTGTINAASITTSDMAATGIAYTNFATLNFSSSNGAGGDSLTVATTMAGTTNVQTNSGNDTVNVRILGGPLNVTTGSGTDVVNVATDSPTNQGTLANIKFPLSVTGGGNTTLNVSNYGATTSTFAATIAKTQITGLGMASTGISYSNIANLNLQLDNTGTGTVAVTGTSSASTNVYGNGSSDTVTVAGSNLAGTNTIYGGSGTNTFIVNTGVGVTGTNLQFVGGTGGSNTQNTILFNGGSTNFTFKLSLASNSTMTGLGSPIFFKQVQSVTVNGGTANSAFQLANNTGLAYGTALAPATGVVYRPISSTSGDIRIDMNPATGVSENLPTTPYILFQNITGSFQYTGSTGGATKDTLTVLGPSTTGYSSGVPLSETTAANGSNKITVSDSLVTISNASLGTLHSIAISPSTLSNLYVYTGNQPSPTGDTVVATPSKLINIVVDGGLPAATTPGDAITININGTKTVTSVTNPTLGPPHYVASESSDGASIGYLNFETVGFNINGSGGGSGNAGGTVIAVGSDAGTPGLVKVYDGNGNLVRQFYPYGTAYLGGVRVAVGDVNGDGIPDIVTATGPGAPPHIEIFDGNTGAMIESYYAFATTFTGGLNIAVADFNGDGYGDVLVGVASNGPPHVEVFSGNPANIGAGGVPTLLRSFYAFAPTFLGGVTLAAGDLNGNGQQDMVIGTAVGPPNVIAYQYSNMAVIRNFYAYAPTFLGGVSVAVGSVSGDGKEDIITGAGLGASNHIEAWEGTSSSSAQVPNLIASFLATSAGASSGTTAITGQSGVRVAVADLGATGTNAILVAGGPGTYSTVQSYRLVPVNPTQGESLSPFPSTFGFGVFIGSNPI